MSQPTRRRRGLTEQAAAAAVDQACRQLRLPTVRGLVTDLVVVAEREQLTYHGFLAELLLCECDDRARRRSVRRVKAAGFPREKSLQDFDFDANTNINPATIHTLAGCGWIRTGQPLCLIGDSGTKLVNELVEAADDRILAKTIARYGRVDLLCIDELGYMELDKRGAEMLFQVLTEREEKNSVAIASNDDDATDHSIQGFSSCCRLSTAGRGRRAGS